MSRLHRQPNIAKRGELLTDRALVHLDAERFFDAPLQIDAAPARNAVFFWIWTLLDQRGELGFLLVGQKTRGSRRPAVRKTRQPFGVVAMRPVAQRLPIHPTALGRRHSIGAFEHRAQSPASAAPTARPAPSRRPRATEPPSNPAV